MSVLPCLRQQVQCFCRTYCYLNVSYKKTNKLFRFYISVPNDDYHKLSANTLSNNGSNGVVSSNGPSNGVESCNGESLEVVEAPAEPLVEGEPLTVTNDNAEAAADSNIEPDATVTTETPRRRSRSLPYTFHCVHGANIKLCSSGTEGTFTLCTAYEY